VLLKASSLSQPNQIFFASTSKSVNLDDADLFIVQPRPGFYIKTVSVEDGIQLTLEGSLQDAQKGPGTNDLKTVMPSMLDRLLNEKGAFALVPSLAALIIGVLERMGVIPK
jgi:hypothetical protein